MWRKLWICAGAVALMSCGGGGGKAALIDACVDEGEDRKDCACMADKMEEGLSPRAFEAMVLSATGKDKEAEEAIEQLGMAEGIAIAGVMVAVVAECGVSGFGDQ